MAYNLQQTGTVAVLTTAVNALTDSGYPGQSAQLARAKTAAIAELNGHASNSILVLSLQGHHDNNGGYINIKVDVLRAASSPPGQNM